MVWGQKCSRATLRILIQNLCGDTSIADDFDVCPGVVSGGVSLLIRPAETNPVWCPMCSRSYFPHRLWCGRWGDIWKQVFGSLDIMTGRGSLEGVKCGSWEAWLAEEVDLVKFLSSSAI